MGCKQVDRDKFNFCCWLFCVITVLTMVALVSWLSLTPKHPAFSISPPQFSDSHPNATCFFVFDVEVSNPNDHLGIYYNGISLEMHRTGGEVIGRNSTPGFYQGYKDVTIFRTSISAGRESLRWTGSGGDFGLGIRLGCDVNFRIIKWKTRANHLTYEEQLGNVTISGLNGTEGFHAVLQNAAKASVGN